MLPASAEAPAAASWAVQQSDTRCAVVRRISGSHPLSLAFSFVPGTTEPDLLLIMKPRGVVPGFGEVTVQVAPSGLDVQGYGRRLIYGGELKMWIDFDSADSSKRLNIEHLRSATAVRIGTGSKQIAEVPLGGWDKALPVLQRCMDAVLTKWGLDPSVQAHLTKAPQAKVNLFQYIRDTDYPEPAVNTGASGTVSFALVVAADGSVAKCMVVRSSGYEILDQATCTALLTRAQFEPALAEDGKPTASVFRGRIRFVLRS